MSVQDSLMNDEMCFLLKTLAEQTKLGRIQWTCTEYTSISLFGGIGEEGNGACISQMFDAVAELHGQAIQVDIMEQIDLHSGKGDISGNVLFDSEQGLERYRYGISYDTEVYDDCDAEGVATHYRESLPAALADALIPILAQSEAIASGFAFACFYYEKDDVKPLLRLPLTKLGEKLMKAKRPADFHRIVLDMDYRNQLLAKLWNF